jgi:hypothetical protein
MKFRASNTNYYIEANSMLCTVVAQDDFFLIKPGSYIDKKCTKHPGSTQMSEEEIIFPLLSNSLSQSIHGNHDKKDQNIAATVNNEKCLQNFLLHSKVAMSRFCCAERLLMTTVTMNHYKGSTIDNMVRFFLTNTGSKVLEIASNIINQYQDTCRTGVPVVPVLRGNEKSSVYEGFISSAHGHMLFDTVGCRVLSPTSQQSVYNGKSDDDACLPLVRYINACQEVQSIAIVVRLAQAVITLIRNKKDLSFLFSSRLEIFSGGQTDAALLANHRDKRRKHVDLHDVIKQKPEHSFIHPLSVPYFSRELVPIMKAVYEPALDPQANKLDHDCSGSYVLDDASRKNQESSRKDRKIKDKKREKRMRTMVEKDQISERESPKRKSEKMYITGNRNVALPSNIMSTVPKKTILNLGDVDNELSTARNHSNDKISSHRNAYLTHKRNQGAAQLGIQNNNKIKWQSWNVFRRDHQDPTSSLYTTKQKYHHCLTHTCSLQNPNVEGCNSLNRAIDNNFDLGQTKMSHETVTCHDYIDWLPTHASDNACHTSRPITVRNSLSSNPLVQIQSAGENPFQLHRDHQTSGPMHADFPTDRKPAALQPLYPKVKVLCSEEFLEFWGDVVAAIVTGKWIKSAYSGSIIQQEDDKTTAATKWGKISIIDSALLNGSGIDMEASHNSCFLVILASHLQSTETAKKYVLKLAELAALGRYTRCYIFFCLDKELTTTMTKHMVKIQFATTTSSVHVICKTTTLNSLATSMAKTILSIPDPFIDEDHLAALSDRLTLDRTTFLTSLLPVASISGTIRCLALAKSLLPIGSPYFEILLKNQRLRQKILITILCNESTDVLNPTVLVQLSDALWHGCRI